MSRYNLPDPRCNHKRRGIVEAGGTDDGPHCATNVCDRPECIADAIEWAETFTRRPATHRRDAEREPTLFEGAS